MIKTNKDTLYPIYIFNNKDNVNDINELGKIMGSNETFYNNAGRLVVCIDGKGVFNVIKSGKYIILAHALDTLDIILKKSNRRRSKETYSQQRKLNIQVKTNRQGYKQWCYVYVWKNDGKKVYLVRNRSGRMLHLIPCKNFLGKYEFIMDKITAVKRCGNHE